jgi:hypothetical protein
MKSWHVSLSNRTAEEPPSPFLVDDVAPANMPISTETLSDHLGKRFRRNCYCLRGRKSRSSMLTSITVLGSLDAWHRIRARVELIETLDLGWGGAGLRLILGEFVQTAKGAPT